MNALPLDPAWCGHSEISLRTWSCPDCDRPLAQAEIERRKSMPTLAPDGYVWIVVHTFEYSNTLDEHFTIEGAYRDRARIPHIQIREHWYSAAEMRALLARFHWYQGAFNTTWFTGWEEEIPSGGRREGAGYVEIRLEEIK